MAGSSANTARTSRTALLLWVIPPLFELPAVLMMSAGFEEVAQEAVYGSPGTELVLAAVLVVVMLSTVLAWRGAVGAMRAVGAAALFVCAGLTAALFVGFLAGGPYVIVAVLLAHSTVSIALIGGAVAQSTTRTEGRRG